jgi:rhodanese-related sulfurtransferase
MKIEGSCYLRRLSGVIGLGVMIWLIVMVEVSQAMTPLQDQHRNKALQEIYECYKKNFPEVPEVTPAEAMKLLEAGQAVFVDVRPLAERRVSQLPGAVTASEFLSSVDSYRGKTVIAYDTVGLRSGLFAEKLRKKGIGIANLQMGLFGWLYAGGKIYDSKGNETRRVHIYGCIWNYAPLEYEAVR